MPDGDIPIPPEGGDVLTDDMYDFLVNDAAFDISLMVEYFCLERFPVMQMFPKEYLETEPPDEYPGRLLDAIRAASGLTIYIYEQAIILGVGDHAFAQWSNYSRMLKTLPEVFEKHLPNKGWDEVAFLASHNALENAAWAMAYRQGLPVGNLAPNVQTEDIIMRLENMDREKGHLRAAEIMAKRDPL